MPDQSTANRGTFVPPTPPKPKPLASSDNPVEMGTGGANEREALEAMQGNPLDVPEAADARGDARIEATGATTDIGCTDNPLGTGVGYAGEGAASYGTQGVTGEDARLGSTTHLTEEEIARKRQEGTGDV